MKDEAGHTLRECLEERLRRREYKDILALARVDRRAVRTLTGLLFHDDPLVIYLAATMFGRMAREAAYLVEPLVFRLLYMLNEESGIVGWGSAQAIAEMNRMNPALARDAARVVAHLMDDPEVSQPATRNTPLLVGSLWAIGDLADARPELAEEMREGLAGFLDDPDPQVRATAAWALGCSGRRGAGGAPGDGSVGGSGDGPGGGSGGGGIPAALIEKLKALADDGAPAQIYEDEELRETTVGAEAGRALSLLAPNP